MTRVLIVGTSKHTRGGITSVIKAHETGEQWKKYHCIWIQTHRDSNAIVKLWYLGTAFLQYLMLVPFCDIVHFHMSENTSAIRKRMLLPIAKLFKKKVIVHFHAFSVDSTICGKHRSIYEYLFCKADLIIVLSEYWKRMLASEINIDEGKIRILYNPCPHVSSRISDNNGKASSLPINKQILYAGTVCQRKGYEDMIRAFAKVASKHRDWKIMFAGNGEIEKGKALAAEMGIADQTVFLGWVNGEAKDKAFRDATIFCLPSYAEGFPMGVLDAWAYGLPVITTPVGGIPDIAVDGKNMLLFNPGDIDELACQMDKMMSCDSLRNAIANESERLSLTTFNIQTINKQLGEIYNELIG